MVDRLLDTVSEVSGVREVNAVPFSRRRPGCQNRNRKHFEI